MFRSEKPRVLLEGPAGTGKSLPICVKLHSIAERHAGARILIERSQRIDLNTTVIPQYLRLVGRKHPIYTDAKPRSIETLVYPNGSTVTFGGLDNVDRVMGSEFDIIWVNEATVGIDLRDIEMLETRFRGPQRTPYRQLIADCNPSYPTHFLHQWVSDHGTDVLKSRHQDNPILHDGEGWTEQGIAYMAVLNRLTGSTKKRMLEGIWAAAEGAVFECLTEERNSFNPSQWEYGYPRLPVIIGMDWGIADPFCILAFIVDREAKTVWCIDEFYEPNLTASMMVNAVKRMMRDFDVRGVYYDPSMGNKRQRDKNLVPGPPPIDDFRTLPVPLLQGRNDSRLAGIDKIRSLLEGFGWLLRIDKDRCPNFWGELEGATWHKTQAGLFVEDIDPKLPDHAITAAYYALRTYFSEVEEIEGGIELNPYR